MYLYLEEGRLLAFNDCQETNNKKFDFYFRNAFIHTKFNDLFVFLVVQELCPFVYRITMIQRARAEARFHTGETMTHKKFRQNVA